MDSFKFSSLYTDTVLDSLPLKWLLPICLHQALIHSSSCVVLHPWSSSPAMPISTRYNWVIIFYRIHVLVWRYCCFIFSVLIKWVAQAASVSWLSCNACCLLLVFLYFWFIFILFIDYSWTTLRRRASPSNSAKTISVWSHWSH